MTTKTAREALFRKIRALLSKTTTAGCTEAEALAAAALARRLMDDYNIAHSDLNEPDEPWADMAFDWKSGNRRKHAWSLRKEIATCIARYSDTRGRFNTDEARVKFFGRESDVLFAGWLLETLDAFGLRAWALFEAKQSLVDEPDTTTPDRESFLLAFATRINERLREESTIRTSAATGTSLVIVRNAVLDAEYAKRFPSLGRFHGQSGRMVDAASYDAGSAAGNRAGFHRPMSGGRGPIMIGGR